MQCGFGWDWKDMQLLLVVHVYQTTTACVDIQVQNCNNILILYRIIIICVTLLIKTA